MMEITMSNSTSVKALLVRHSEVRKVFISWFVLALAQFPAPSARSTIA
jgi:hypothetical protein